MAGVSSSKTAARDGLRVLVVAALFVIACVGMVGCEDQPARLRASLALEECVVEGSRRLAKCGIVKVPLDPQRPEGAVVGLKVAVFEAEARRAEPDAIFLLAGGPGQSAVRAFASQVVSGMRLGVRRDIVLVDVRGTGGSDALRCGSDASIAAMLRLSPDTKRLQRCAEKYAERAPFHTTAHLADDLDLVRKALGYERINLVGTSYGTRLAFEYLRRHPTRASPPPFIPSG